MRRRGVDCLRVWGEDMVRPRRLLFVCEGNAHRSPTAERICADVPGVLAKSAGLSHLARTQVTEELLDWADVVFVMERRLERMLRRSFGEHLAGRQVVSLDVPDDYQFMQAELIAVLAERLAPHMGLPDARGEEQRDG